MRYEEATFGWHEADDGPVDVSDLTRLRLETDRGVATVTLDRPAVRNAIDGPMLDELTRVLHHCDRSDDVRVVVLTGAGPVFCAGSEMSGDGFGGAPGGDEDGGLPWLAPFQLRKPVVAAVNGHAVGAGLTLALQCDVRVVAADAVLAFPFVRLGVVAEWMGHWTAVRHLGPARAAELLLTGRRFSGSDAAAWGLANHAPPAEGVLSTAVSIAREIADHTAPVAVAVSKRLIWEATDADQPTAGATERRLLEALLAAPDAAEGVAAYLGKRAPRWVGRVGSDLPPWPTP
ncbi:Enoyl-CoA hydratase/carnithine racemase [Thermomonospora echinospora]|uniref:Enoyl-CoA hydratase/carnithine racemase n=1 Tax=Thermomonospora echinospora TaxID=1992 RepID=A0A1H6E2P4_9ACTN|nr:enoyl-CoA hydratase/isomerase family protein [Thermomonospora echinospora]SEG91892.1 Enoyl-CoA hydratase/carnithine racemase [Thermomonospora echinospora]